MAACAINFKDLQVSMDTITQLAAESKRLDAEIAQQKDVMKRAAKKFGQGEWGKVFQTIRKRKKQVCVGVSPIITTIPTGSGL